LKLQEARESREWQSHNPWEINYSKWKEWYPKKYFLISSINCRWPSDIGNTI